MPNSQRNRFADLLGWGQFLILGLIIFLSVISRPRQMLLQISSQQNIPLEFRMISLSIPDIFVILLLALTLIRLIGVADYRQQLFETANGVLTNLGGIWWVALALWTMMGLAWAQNGTMLRFSMVYLIAVLLMALILADLIRERQDRFLLWALLISAVIQSGLGVLQVLNNGPLGLWGLGEIERFSYDPTDFYRAPGLAMHYNYLAGYLLVALFACILLGWRRWQAKQPLRLLVLIAIIITIGIVSTLSRSALVATAVGFSPLIFIFLRRANRRTRRMIVGGGIVAVIGAVVWALFTLGSIANIQTRFFTGREFFFDYSWAVIQQSPILGVGAGNLMLEAGLMWGLNVENLLPVHNVYLFIWAEQGLPGLALFLLGCGTILWRLRRTDQPELLIWTCCFLALCTINLFDNYLWAVHPFRVVFFWVIGLWWAYAYPLTLTIPETAPTPAVE